MCATSILEPLEVPSAAFAIKVHFGYWNHFGGNPFHSIVWLGTERNEKVIPFPCLVGKTCVEIEKNYEKMTITPRNAKNYMNILTPIKKLNKSHFHFSLLPNKTK